MLIDLQGLYSLNDQVAVVTGAAQGMGEAIARSLAGVGATVIVADIQNGRAGDVAAAISTDGGSAEALYVDMADEASVVAMMGEARERFGRLDVLVNCAGTQDRNFIEDTTAEFWDRVFAVNLRGPFIATREAIRIMRADRTRGRIVNIGSTSSFHATAPSIFAYSTSKAGVAGLTRASAMEAVRDGIRVNAICPGNTTTPGQASSTGPAFPPDQIAKFMPPIGRTGTPQDIANAVLFAATDASAFMTGETIVIDGGMLSC